MLSWPSLPRSKGGRCRQEFQDEARFVGMAGDAHQRLAGHWAQALSGSHGQTGPHVRWKPAAINT